MDVRKWDARLRLGQKNVLRSLTLTPAVDVRSRSLEDLNKREMYGLFGPFRSVTPPHPLDILGVWGEAPPILDRASDLVRDGRSPSSGHNGDP